MTYIFNHVNVLHTHTHTHTVILNSLSPIGSPLPSSYPTPKVTSLRLLVSCISFHTYKYKYTCTDCTLFFPYKSCKLFLQK